MPKHSRWAPAPATPESWKPPPGRSLAEATREQDSAAGGRRFRRVATDDGGVATASIELKHVGNGRRVYAYLRYSAGKRTVSIYVGEAVGRTRTERLRHAWRLVRDGRLTKRAAAE